MTLRIYIFSLMLAATQLLAAQSITRIDGSHISQDSLSRKIQKLMARNNVTGLCISVFNDNEPVFTKAYGYAIAIDKKPMTTSTVMYSASFSKLVFAYIAMKMVEAGNIDLDSPLVSYLDSSLVDYKFDAPDKGYQDLKNDPRYKKITARMCLDHTTGLPNYRAYEADKKLKILYEPGTRYLYSGEGMYLLQFVIEKVTGKSLESTAGQKVFRPLHMNNTSFIWKDKFGEIACVGHDNMGRSYMLSKSTDANSAQSMVTSIEDFAKFCEILFKQKGLKKSTYDQMLKPQIRIRSKQQLGGNAFVETNENDKVELSYGLGFGLIKTPYGKAFFKEGHDGGFQHYFISYPDKGIAVIIMTNSENGEGIFKELLGASIGDIYTPWAWENYIPQ